MLLNYNIFYDIIKYIKNDMKGMVLMVKRFFVFLFAVILTFSVIPAYGNTLTDKEVIKYDKELYYVGADIPADSYILISKDVTKPAYFGVYTNDLGQGAKFDKKRKVLVGKEEDYIYPHYFEDNEFYSYTDFNVPDNQGNLKISRYFEYSAFVDLSGYRIEDARNDFLYLENCYAVSIKDIEKINIEFNRDGFMPVKNNLVKGQTYKMSVANDERMGLYCFYKYDKFLRKLIFINNYSNVIFNKAYNSGKGNFLYDTDVVTVPEDADIMLKIGINVSELNGKEIYPLKGITFPENFNEKYDFNNVSEVLKNVTIQEFKGIREEEIALRNKPSSFTKTTIEAKLDRKRIFKNLEAFAKTDADYEYIKYVREAYVMYAQAPYIDLLVGKYLYNATSFEDLSILLRKMAYNDYRTAYYTYSVYNLYKNYFIY